MTHPTQWHSPDPQEEAAFDVLRRQRAALDDRADATNAVLKTARRVVECVTRHTWAHDLKIHTHPNGCLRALSDAVAVLDHREG